MDVVRGPHPGRRAPDRVAEHHAGLRRTAAEELLHRCGGQGDLVAADRAQLLRAQGDEGILNAVSLIAGARGELGWQRPEALAAGMGVIQPPRGALGAELGLLPFFHQHSRILPNYDNKCLCPPQTTARPPAAPPKSASTPPN